MFEFKTIVTQPIYQLIYIKPCLTTTPTRCAIKNRRKKQTKKSANTKKFTAKTEYLNLKAHSNNVKMQTDKTLTTQN